jgi:DNA-binding PadR family transcriptional regulator
MRLTYPGVRVAQVLMNDPYGTHWGYALSQSAHVLSGTLQQILTRMLGAGWLESEWEILPAAGAGRPPRRLYRLTPDGRKQLKAYLTDARHDARYAGLFR